MKTHARKAFSMVEVLIATLLIGLAFVALMTANSAFSTATGAGMNISTAEFLVEQIREMTVSLAVRDPETNVATFGPEEASLADYDDLDDFDGLSFCPPIGADRAVLSAYPAFTQQITVENVSNTDFKTVVADHSTDFVRVTVRVLYNGSELASSSWIRAYNDE